MGLTENIILWTFSLILAAVGIIFGIIASVNSHRANIAVKDLIASSWISDESEKLFFKNMKRLIIANNHVLTLLKSPTTYKSYSLAANGTRFSPINTRSAAMLEETEYKDVLESYINNKQKLEASFKKIVESYKVLSTTAKIVPAKRNDLIKYHKSISKVASGVIKEYTKLIRRDE
ncbi:MAG: hypothetical protein KAG04_01820 [Mycoplasmataceae bacterium]|nr:hypothetical protein [Mycoplasmataceae bacterium]